MDIKDLDAYDIRLLRNSLPEFTEATIKNTIRSFGQFLEYFTGTNLCDEARLRWNGYEIERIWITTNDWKNLFGAAGPMMKLILAIGGTMGLRRAEILAIKVNDIKGRILRVTGKGTGCGKIIDMEMSDAVLKCLAPYLEWRTETVTKYGDRSEGSLFLCPLKKMLGKPLSPTVLNRLISELSEKTGITWTIHSLRRLYCMTMVDAGIDMDTIRRMMRHANVETTENAYVKADPRKMHGAHNTVNSAFSAFMHR